ncbi:cytochrome P450 [Hypoxylon sp. FL1284]|nr:cytochrome P450 [Hypoxylon sp. FL1284]
MSWFQPLLVASLSSTAVYVGYSWVCLLRNYNEARKVGVPVRVIPISPGNTLWTFVDKQVVSLFKKLPLGNGTFTRYNWRGWEIEDRYRSHLEMGDVFIQVTPGRNWLYVCNPESLLEIFRRRGDFRRPLDIFEPLNIFGPNLYTVDGEQWKRQRKIASTCFDEQINEVVWGESVSLATDMLRYWTSKDSVSSVAEDTRTFSLHVLARAGFGKSYKFHGHDERLSTTTASSYKDFLKTILDNCVLITALGAEFFTKPGNPGKVHKACASFQNYMTKVYEDEKRAFAKGKETDRNLMTSLVRASQEEAQNSEALTEKEIYGNIFLFNFAGHDTTAHTLTYTFMFLAANPAVQDWISEELRYVLGDKRPFQWHYKLDFPRLKRCVAVLMETVRLYTPVPIATWTDKQAQTLKVGDRTISVPPETMVVPSYAAIHTHPDYWGADALSWRPSRWIAKRPNSFEEDVVSPPPGVFVGWSDGERACPGSKFSQVAAVAAMAGAFRDWRVDPVPQAGETLEAARARVLRLIEKDSAQVLVLQMMHPERAPLVWRRR